ncbi:MAG: AAA family ATPase [Methylococcaceae bacterium]
MINEQNVFITAIHVDKVRHIENFDIALSETERKHLIITGKNGSGKTSLLLEIDKFIKLIKNEHNSNYLNYVKELEPIHDKEQKIDVLNKLDSLFLHYNFFESIRLSFTTPFFATKECLYVFFQAKRQTNLDIPKGISKIQFNKNYNLADNINKAFIQYIVNLKAERSFARDDNDNETVTKIDAWFLKFENSLKDLFETDNLTLVFDRQNYNFSIHIPKREPFTLAGLSDGYSAVIDILTELILRMEANGNRNYDQQGIVLIDEIETHLHVALQKKVLPFLCSFFPNIQFIVTTHSPFVLSSISNAVICDLETREVISKDLSGYSYSALVESYFDVDKYSAEVKEKLARFEYLSEKNSLIDDEQDEYDDLQDYFKSLPTFHADELAVKVQQIKLKKLFRKA